MMMKIIAMSDSHGDVETVKTIANLPADAHFHCGDSELSYDDSTLANMHKIRGNCDEDMTFTNNKKVQVGDINILIVHGHQHNVHASLMELYYFALENDAQVVLFGHTHLFGVEMKDGILFVNPGSTTQPRGGKERSYAIIEWGDKLEVTFKNMSHEVIETITLKRF